VPGVGERPRRNSSRSTRDFDDLYAHLDTLTPKLRENLATYEDRARNNEMVMRLVRDVPLDFTLDDLTLGGWNRQEVDTFFERFEMNSMATRMTKLMKAGLLGEPASQGRSSVAKIPAKDSPTLKHEASLAALLKKTPDPVVAFNEERVAVFNAASGALVIVDLDEFLKGVGAVAIAGHDVKRLFRLGDQRGVTLSEPADDTSIMAFLIDAISGHYDLADVAQRVPGRTNHRRAALAL